MSLPPNTFSSDVTKHGRANKPSASCPEPAQNWMKDEDAYSASLYYIVQNYGPRQLPPWNSSHIEHFIIQLNVHIIVKVVPLTGS